MDSENINQKSSSGKKVFISIFILDWITLISFIIVVSYCSFVPSFSIKDTSGMSGVAIIFGFPFNILSLIFMLIILITGITVLACGKQTCCCCRYQVCLLIFKYLNIISTAVGVVLFQIYPSAQRDNANKCINEGECGHETVENAKKYLDDMKIRKTLATVLMIVLPISIITSIVLNHVICCCNYNAENKQPTVYVGENNNNVRAYNVNIVQSKDNEYIIATPA